MRQFIEQLAGPRVKQENKFVRPHDRRGQHRQQGGGQHPGLLLQRYLCENATGEGGNPEEKRAILQAAINATDHLAVRELYHTAYKRWKDELDGDTELTKSVILQTVGRLIVGLGTENVLETGIRLHHTYGMPILPGPALKGLASHYCDQVWGERDKPTPSEDALKFRGARKEDHVNKRPAEPQGQYHRLLFGATDDGGCINFQDGWFVLDSENAPLKLDVMTPHHPKWLDGEVPPTDFDSPIPVPFLSVSGKFHVAVSWHGPTSDKALRWCDLVLDCLRDALFNWGIGGKTTSDYGRLAEPPPPAPYKGKTNDVVDAVLLEEKTKKSGWRAQIMGHSQAGEIQNTDQVPADAKPGDQVRLVIASLNDQKAAFKWPQAAKK